jgi:hypothetical protein
LFQSSQRERARRLDSAAREILELRQVIRFRVHRDIGEAFEDDLRDDGRTPLLRQTARLAQRVGNLLGLTTRTKTRMPVSQSIGRSRALRKRPAP